jgi:hypothetical protein
LALAVDDEMKMEPLGLEPKAGILGTDDATYGCVVCQKCGAALALQTGRSHWPDLASIDADLQALVSDWQTLPDAIRQGMTALVQASSPSRKDSK